MFQRVSTQNGGKKRVEHTCSPYCVSSVLFTCKNNHTISIMSRQEMISYSEDLPYSKAHDSTDTQSSSSHTRGEVLTEKRS